MNQFELNQELEVARVKHRDLLASFPMKKMADGSEAPDIPADRLEEIRKSNDNLGELVDRLDVLRKASDLAREERKVANRLDVGTPEQEVRKSGKNLVNAVTSAYKSFGDLRRGEIDVKDFDPAAEFKTTVTTTAGYAPFVSRLGPDVDSVQKRPTLLDFLPVVTVNENAYKFMRETTFTNNAGVKDEGAAFDEAALAWTEITVGMNRVGVHIPITDVQIADEAGVQQLVQNRLGEMVRIKADDQILNGNGTAPQWEGLLNMAGIQTQAKGADPIFDAVFKGIVLVNNDGATTNGGANANLIVMNIADLQDIVTARTADGIYIYGNPADAPGARLWGLPILLNSNLAAGTALVLDTMYHEVALRQGIRVAISDSHGTDFTGGVLRIRVDMRGNVASYRESAACKVTGL